MPAGYAHLDFGNQVLDILEPKMKEIVYKHRDLYNIGVHGPDILFYHKPLSKNEVSTLGNAMHREYAYDFFMESKEIIARSQDREAALVYILGFITHFTLDSECHGYVGEIERDKHLTHSEIESEFDRALLVMKGLNPLTTSLTSHVHPTSEIEAIIAPFFHLQPNDIKNSLKGMKTYLGFLLAPGRIKRGFILLAMKIAGIYDGYKGLMINYQPNPACKSEVEELINKKNKAIKIAHSLIKDYINHMDESQLNERFRRDYG